ncbi:bidirectional sugar transporter SWEET17-like [Salvia splendens]|uniref:bidirectional sugar transporter SWEET17-like n=1 Tax=Salvia splendens TaxID=180675 RepID=UPI001C260D7E|nr:bidirectional sugar transporter SWEET17-like [Salvia splendens]
MLHYLYASTYTYIFLILFTSHSNMDTLVFFVGVIGNVISVLMLLSPGKTFVRIVKKKSTEEFESLPYICTLLNCELWTYYGIIKPDSYLVATINAFGVVAEITYIALFLIFAPPNSNKRLNTALLVGIVNVGFVASTFLVTCFVLDGEDLRIDSIGFLSAALNIIMYASPLSALKTVVTTKSAEFMPFLLTFFLFLNGGIWTFYAFLVQDWFLGVPNSIGFVLGALQLLLYAIYRNPTNSDEFETNQISQTESLLPRSSIC